MLDSNLIIPTFSYDTLLHVEINRARYEPSYRLLAVDFDRGET